MQRLCFPSMRAWSRRVEPVRGRVRSRLEWPVQSRERGTVLAGLGESGPTHGPNITTDGPASQSDDRPNDRTNRQTAWLLAPGRLFLLELRSPEMSPAPSQQTRGLKHARQGNKKPP